MTQNSASAGSSVVDLSHPDADPHGRVDPPANAGEWETLTGFLDYQRGTLAWKTSGLSADQLRQHLAPTSMTLAGLLNHMAHVEDCWLSRVLHGKTWSDPWASVDWKASPDWEWETALMEEPAVLAARWEESVHRARALAQEAYAAGGLDGPSALASGQDTHPSLRWIIVHMIEEYARHLGHADLLREAIDGETGE